MRDEIPVFESLPPPPPLLTCVVFMADDEDDNVVVDVLEDTLADTSTGTGSNEYNIQHTIKFI